MTEIVEQKIYLLFFSLLRLTNAINSSMNPAHSHMVPNAIFSAQNQNNDITIHVIAKIKIPLLLMISLLKLPIHHMYSTHLIKLKYIKPCFFIINSVNFSINDRNYHLTGCTHDSSVQMPSKHFTFLISDTHMKMRIIFSIHCIDRTCQRCDFIIPFKTV